MWRQHIFSKRVRNLAATFKGALVDEFHFLTAEDESTYTPAMRFHNRSSAHLCDFALFIGEEFDSIHFGVGGAVAEAMPDSAYAHERTIRDGKEKIGREIMFVHCFSADQRSTTKIPSFEEILARCPEFLEPILRQANSGDNNIVPARVAFSRARPIDGVWNSFATDFERGKRNGEMAIFSRTGELVEVLVAEGSPSKDPDASMLDRPPGQGSPTGGAARGISGESRDSRNASQYLKHAGVGSKPQVASSSRERASSLGPSSPRSDGRHDSFLEKAARFPFKIGIQAADWIRTTVGGGDADNERLGGRSQRLTAADISLIKRLIDEGLNPNEISRRTGIDEKLVCKWAYRRT
jgi:hypothetical protein